MAGYNLIRLPKLIAAQHERQPDIANSGNPSMTFTKTTEPVSKAGYNCENPNFSSLSSEQDVAWHADLLFGRPPGRA